MKKKNKLSNLLLTLIFILVSFTPVRSLECDISKVNVEVGDTFTYILDSTDDAFGVTVNDGNSNFFTIFEDANFTIEVTELPISGDTNIKLNITAQGQEIKWTNNNFPSYEFIVVPDWNYWSEVAENYLDYQNVEYSITTTQNEWIFIWESINVNQKHELRYDLTDGVLLYYYVYYNSTIINHEYAIQRIDYEYPESTNDGFSGIKSVYFLTTLILVPMVIRKKKLLK